MTYTNVRDRTYELLNPYEGARIGRLVDLGIMALIVLSVAAIVVGTVDAIGDRYARLLWYFEVLSVAVFTAEYVLRIWSVTASESYDRPIVGRLRYAATPYLIIDLLAILPFYLGVVIDLRFLRVLRLFRVFRALKIARYSTALRTMILAIRRKRAQLFVAAVIGAIALVLTSSILYYVERSAQPETFSSIPATFWWGFVTLTTVGYGNVVPVTPLGRFLAGVFAFVGIGLFGLPASILAAGFVEVAEEQREAAGEPSGDEPAADEPAADEPADGSREYAYCPHCGEEL